MNRTKRIYNFILKFKQDNDGLSPTFREIAAGVGLSSNNSVKYQIEKLVKFGLLEGLGGDGKARNIKVIGGQWRPPQK
jgi:SOS-response transcriptional repressor LexA